MLTVAQVSLDHLSSKKQLICRQVLLTYGHNRVGPMVSIVFIVACNGLLKLVLLQVLLLVEENGTI
uniref:Uncharacterized protein n=1 Tax=Arundo donax TaxID=35708 RepID=A0A0A9DZ90_ARUDO